MKVHLIFLLMILMGCGSSSTSDVTRPEPHNELVCHDIGNGVCSLNPRTFVHSKKPLPSKISVKYLKDSDLELIFDECETSSDWPHYNILRGNPVETIAYSEVSLSFGAQRIVIFSRGESCSEEIVFFDAILTPLSNSRAQTSNFYLNND